MRHRVAATLAAGVAITGSLAGCSIDLGTAEPAATPVPATTTETPEPTVDVPPVDAPGGWAETVRTVRSGVVHLSVGTCDGGGIGSGSLVAPDLVLTAAHVVEGAAYITLRTQSEVAEGYVVDYSPGTELALVRAERDLTGHVFTLAESDPPEGTAVAALGYPLDESLSITEGIVSAVGVEGWLNDYVVPDQLRTSVAVNPGNSGGPLVLEDGTEVGVVSSVDLLPEGVRAEGRSNAISAAAARRVIDGLPPDPEPLTLATCDFEQPPEEPFDTVVRVDIASADPRAPLFGQFLGQHGQGINDGDYAGAFAAFTPAMQDRMGGLDVWSSALATSYWQVLTVQDVAGSDAAPLVTATLQTVQAPDDGYEGQTCSVFDLRYSLVAAPESDSGWLIDRAAGDPPTPC